MIGIPKGTGQKGGVPKYTRKRKMNDIVPPKKVIDQLSNCSPTFDTETNPKPPSNVAYTAIVHGQQINVQGQVASSCSVNHPSSGTFSVNNPMVSAK